MVGKNLNDVAPCENHNGMLIISELLVRLPSNVGRGHKHTKLSRTDSRDQTGLCPNRHGGRRSEALRLNRKVELDGVALRSEECRNRWRRVHRPDWGGSGRSDSPSARAFARASQRTPRS